MKAAEFSPCLSGEAWATSPWPSGAYHRGLQERNEGLGLGLGNETNGGGARKWTNSTFV